jgi:hypothetical protein
MVVSTSIRAASHTDHPLRVRHLIVAHPQRRCHLVREGSSNNHDICLTRRGAEDDAQTVLVVAGHRSVHHLDAAAGEGESQRPDGAGAGPGGELVEGGSVLLGETLVAVAGWTWRESLSSVYLQGIFNGVLGVRIFAQGCR